MMATSLYDHIFNVKLDSWTSMHKAYYEFFSEQEIQALHRSERAFVSSNRTIVFCSFENRFASLGGLAAVAKYLPQSIKKAGERVVFVTPFHAENKSVKKAFDAGLFKTLFEKQTFHLCNYEGVMSCYQDTSSDIPSYYIQIDNHFVAGDDPYSYSEPDRLLFDSMAFSAAIPFTLNKLDINSNLIFHAHDWETALIAVTSKMAVICKLLSQARTVLTLHNSFDSGIPPKFKQQFFGKQIPFDTVLQCAIPMLNGPLTTVSTPFAHELRNDPLQKGIFTNHLQTQFSMNPPLGIENGMFGEHKVIFNSVAMERASLGKYDKISSQKLSMHKKGVELISEADDARIKGALKWGTQNVPLFFMSGRLDFMQKGFDAIFHSFRRLKRGSAKLLFCPSSNTAGTDSNLKFFEDIANECEGDITIWPFRVPSGHYETLLRGASFMIMPSFYEPFGAATEGFIHGTPVLARGTGGLWTQVNPFDGIFVPETYNGILHLADRSRKPTGILYREKFDPLLAEKEWIEIFKLSPENRIGSDLYVSMVDAAFEALNMAISLYNDKERYGELIWHGSQALHQFSWESAVKKYRRVYDAAVFRGL